MLSISARLSPLSLELVQSQGRIIVVSDRPLIVLTLEGLATSALSCYGSSWNSTPAIDEIAASGCVWDRWTATSDQPLSLLKQWVLPSEPQQDDWLSRWTARGSVNLLTDDSRVIDQGIGAGFDQTLWVDPSESCTPGEVATEISQTQFGRLITSAVDRDTRDEWSVIWIHSRFLSERWDAPRELFPIDDPDDSQSPYEEVELLVDPTAGPSEAPIESPPPLFDTVVPPRLQLDPNRHCDLVTAWMRTYGCQVRLVDLLIEMLLQSIRADDPQVVVAGTSGFSLGQNGWIGHSAGPLRSGDLRLPIIVSDRGPIRSPQVTATDTLRQILAALASDSGSLIRPDQWCQNDDEFSPRVVTESARAEKVVTTPKWSFIRDLDSTDHLYLKPDDVEDANDVSRLRHDVIDEIIARNP